MDKAHSDMAPKTTGAHRVLLVATEELLGDELFAELETHAADRRKLEIVLVAPAIAETRLQHVMGGVDAGIEEARSRLEPCVARLRERGFEIAQARIGDADPIEAISDALLERPGAIDEIVLVTRSGEERLPLEKGEFERAEERFELPITHIAIAGSSIADEEHAAPSERDTSGELHPESRNLPPLTRRDVIAMVVGFVGTLVLIVLAANCASEIDVSSLAFGACEVTFLLAGGFFLINVAHVFALTMFQVERYRGPFEKFFSGVSLYGTTAAVILGLLLA